MWRRGAPRCLCLLALASAAAPACHTFDDPSTVHDLRILAVKVDPSEVILEDAATEPPALTLTPLIADPAGGGRAVTWTLRACPNDPRGPAPPNANPESNYPAGGAYASVGSERCAADSPLTRSIPASGEAQRGAQISWRFSRAELDAAFAVDRFVDQAGVVHGGFDLGLPITLELVATAGEESAVAVKRALFWAGKVRDDQRPNSIPTVAEVRAYGGRDPDSQMPLGRVVTLVAGEPRMVPPGAILWVEPAPADAEPYVTAVIDRLTDQVVPHQVEHETLRYTFHATAGTFLPLQTSNQLDFGMSSSTGRVPLESRYRAPGAEALPVDPATGRHRLDVTIWIVVRDERGGMSWTERKLLVTD
jgi:hypothetical protein